MSSKYQNIGELRITWLQNIIYFKVMHSYPQHIIIENIYMIMTS